MDELLEVLAERSHISWAKKKQAQGYANHAWMTRRDHPNECAAVLEEPGGLRRCDLPEDGHHPDMVPYADLAENVKNLDRATVRGVLEGIAEAGHVIVTRDGLRQMGEAVALLNSMLLSGEDHSDRSRAAVDYAAAIAGAVR